MPGIVGRFAARAAGVIADLAGRLESRFGGAGWSTSSLPIPVLSGVTVTPETALTYATAYACIVALSTDLAMPMTVRKRRSGGSVEQTNDPRNRLLHTTPNANTTSVRFRRSLYAHRFTYGNGFAEIARIKSGRYDGYPGALHLHSPKPVDTWAERSRNGSLWYLVDGGKRTVRAEDMIHVAGLGYDGITGYSPIALHRQIIGQGLAQAAHAAAFHGNALTPKGAIRVKKRLTPERKAELREGLERMHSGPGNAHRFLLLEEDSEFQAMSIPPVEAQFLESIGATAGQVCQIYQVPPPRVQVLADVSSVYKALSDMLTAYRNFTLAPEILAISQDFDSKLFTEGERRAGWHVHHDFGALMRGSLNEMVDYLAKRFAVASITPDEIRQAFGENPIEGELGNRYYVASTYSPLDEEGEPDVGGSDPADAGAATLPSPPSAAATVDADADADAEETTHATDD